MTTKPQTTEKPWGNFQQFSHNEKTTVKILTVKPHSKLSLQFHNHREEFWKVISGTGQIILDNKTIDVKPDQEFFIPKKINHRIMTTDSELKILEISYGDFDENDITRLEDDYNRLTK